MWIVIDDATGEIVSGPLDAEPTPGAGQAVLPAALGWPDTMTYDPASRRFHDAVPAPVPPVDALAQLLVAKGLITNAEAARALAGQPPEAP